MGLNAIQHALDNSAPLNTTPLGANLQLIERPRSNRGNTVCYYCQKVPYGSIKVFSQKIMLLE